MLTHLAPIDELLSPEKSIAIVGCYPETWELAPYADEAWDVWGFSRRNFGKLPRCTKWFELHQEVNFERYDRDLKGYLNWLRQPFVVTQKDFPWEDLVSRFGGFFFGSGQVAWLLAYAIMRMPPKIGLWGVESVDKYASQRFEIQHFAQVAHDLGIQIVVPVGCTLLERRPFYGFESNKTH